MPFYAKYSAASSASAVVTANQGTDPWHVDGKGTPGTPVGGVLTVQGDPANTPLPVSIPTVAVNKVALLTNNYASVNVTTAAYVQLTAATTATINKLYIFDSSGSALVLAVGAAASEVDQVYIFPGGVPSVVSITIPSGSRISIKAVDANAISGALYVTATS